MYIIITISTSIISLHDCYLCAALITNKRDFVRCLLSWHNTDNQRSMPWKGIRDPYFVWLSEIILQQTRVEQGTAYYQRFIKNYPNVTALAGASEEKLFKLWEGLGYYSRCRNLIKTAHIIVETYGGKFPADYAALLSLPGVGPYTAAAIASFAFDLPYAVVDGNVYRILSRYFGIATPIDSLTGKKAFANLAQELIPHEDPASFNQAIMDFGATVCKPKLPLCNECVLRKSCAALKKDLVQLLPVKEKKIIKETRFFYYGVIKYRDEVLIRKRTDRDIWQNLYELFLAESDEPKLQPKEWVQGVFEKHSSAKLTYVSTSEVYKQILTHRRICGNFVVFKINKRSTVAGYDWIKVLEAKNFPFPIFIQQFAGKEMIAL